MHQTLPIPARTRICLGVCTYQRPVMLMRCLNSLIRMEAPADCQLDIVVVDNNPGAYEQKLVSDYAGYRVHYVHEPRRGIPQARNAILDKAKALGATWIAMLDDDQRVSSWWLNEMWLSAKAKEADVVENCVNFEFPKPLSRWAFPKQRDHDWSYNRKHAATNGVLFRADMASADGPLRFDEQFGLTGGEDGDFFWRAHHHCGAYIIRTPLAVSTEIVPESRLTFGAQVWRAYWIAAIGTRQNCQHNGFFDTLARKSIKAAGSLIGGMFRLAIAPWAFAGDAYHGRRLTLQGAKKLARAAGIVVGLFGLARPEPYRTVHGE